MTNKKKAGRRISRRRKRAYWRRRNRSASVSDSGKVPGDYPVLDHRLKAVFSKTAMDKILAQVEGDVYHETGAFLIGTLLTDHINGDTLAVVDDIYTDGCYGSASNYTFTARHQVDAVSYILRKYGESKHMIGTVHSHAQFDAFYSGTDYTMMNSRLSEEIHMVLSPSHRTYVLTYKDLDYEYHNDIVLEVGSGFSYRRNRQ